MRPKSRKWRWLGLVGLILVGAFFVVRTWVVPIIIARAIEAKYHGKVAVGDWWLGWNSAGVKDVKLMETARGDTPPWFTAESISTDVSLSRLLRGRVMPTRVEVDRPTIAFKFDAKGQPITKIPVGEPGSKAPAEPIILPLIVAKGGQITLDQQGRKPMTIKGVDARLTPKPDGSDLDVTTDDPTWGRVAVDGHFNPTFKDGTLQINSSPGFVADPAKLEQIPFVPAEVWANLEPRGPVDARVKITLAADSPKPVTVHTELTLKGTAARLNSLQVVATDATGHVVIDDADVKLDDLQGKTLGGTIGASGKLDFGHKVPKFDLDVRLKEVDVTKAPASWQLGEVGATGKLSGRVDLRVALDPSGPDLTGTAGRAVIENGSFQGIPVKALSLGLRADGNDLQYETLPEGSVDKNNLDSPIPIPPASTAGAPGSGPGAPSPLKEVPKPVLAALPLLDLASHNQGVIGWAALFAKELVAYQVREARNDNKGGLRLPKTISTRIELEDVDLLSIVDKARKFGFVVSVPVAGRLSIKATATIPLGSLRDVRAYAFRGDATLRGTSIDHVDLGLVTAHVDLAHGRIDVTDFRGQFVDKPNGNDKNPPKPSGDVPSRGPLPRGAFRAQIHAAIEPKGDATAQFEGNALPIGEIFAPFLPQPTPVSGEVTLQVDARGDLARLSDPGTWSLRGHIDSRQIKYQDAVLDEVASKVEVKDGRVEVSDFAARLMGKPLHALGRLELAPPYRYSGGITIEGWEIAEVAKFVPGVPNPPPASGSLDAKGEAAGSLQPFDIATKGAARVLGVKAGASTIGNVGFQWKTDADVVSLTGLELYAFGGRTTGEARIPIKPGQPVHASAILTGIDAARLSSAFLGKELLMTGRADGRVELSMPLDASTVDGQATLESPDLTVRQPTGQGMAVKSLLVRAVARKGTIDYEATAQGLGGKFRFRGSAPIVGDLTRSVAEGEALAVGFRLGDVAKALGMAEGMANLDGVGAFDANIRAPLKPFQVSGRGQFEMRDLRYGKMPPLGTLRGVASLGPSAWRVDRLEGDLMGGIVSGEARGDRDPAGPKAVNFDLKVDRASLARMARLFPSLSRDVEGFGSLRVAGRAGAAIQASAEMLVSRARVMGLQITDLRLPVEFEMVPASGSGSIHSRQWTARVAGGSIKGSAWNRFGHDHSFQSDLQLTGVDLAALMKIHPMGKKPPTGKVSGKVILQGPNVEHVEKMRGRIDLDLDDASLFELPLFKELDKFLGSSGGGGIFDDGDVHGTIANKTLYLEQFTLTGRLVQLHATGSVGFNGSLNLEVLVNTNATLSPSELALLNVIPGLGQALGSGEEAIRRVTSVLESSLLRFRVSGSSSNPHVQIDPGVSIGSGAVGFFTSVIKVPGR